LVARGWSLSSAALLLDEHIALRVAHALRRRSIDAIALSEWHAGSFLGRRDEDILAAAKIEGRTLVTYDLHTIPPLLRRLAQAGISHAGVVLVSVRSIPLGDTRRLTRSLGRLIDRHPDGITELVLFLSA
jgi:uncharacterized protein DUF5615